MAQEVGALRVSMEADEARIARDFGKARKHAKGFNDGASRGFKRTNRASKEMTDSLKRAGAAILFIAGPAVIGAFVKASIKAAGDADEAWSKFEAVFKDQAIATKAWALDFANAVGRSTSDVAKWLSTLQDTFVPMGLARDKAADLSQSLVALAVDLGSFNDIADEEVIESFQSALVGNTETVRKFGIVINETNTKQEAYISGIAETGSKLTEQQKILARYNLILAGTQDAQGDVERTSDSLNNRTKAMNASWKNFTETLGKKFVPEASATVGWLDSLFKSSTRVVSGLFGAEKRFESAARKIRQINLALQETTNEFVKADLEKKLEIQTNLLGLAADQISRLNGELVLTEEEMRGTGEATGEWARELENLEEPIDIVITDVEVLEKGLDKTDESMKDIAADSLVLKLRLALVDEQLNKNIVTVKTSITQGQLLQLAMEAAFAAPDERGDAFKGFVLSILSLIESVIIASGALSKSLTLAFTPLGIAGAIVALGVLEAAKAGVRAIKFGDGGQFTVPGSGGRDTTPVSFLATPGEEVSIRTPAQVAAGVGGGRGDFILHQNITFEGITPERFIDEAVIPRIEDAARSAASDILTLKNIADGSDLNGDLLRVGKS